MLINTLLIANFDGIAVKDRESNSLFSYGNGKGCLIVLANVSRRWCAYKAGALLVALFSSVGFASQIFTVGTK